jgi:UDP-2-acetamido-2,6-beta-L-arabino-hexul-4-ose reductase
MKRICITGYSGLLGKHLFLFLLSLGDEVEIVPIEKSDWESTARLSKKITGADAVVHLAGMNRGDERLLYKTNISLAQMLIEACETYNLRPHIVFPSSTHEAYDTAYGRSKREISNLLVKWGKRTKTPVSVFILPHVFGEFGKPFHNSGISTMCYQLAKEEQPDINPLGHFELVHAREVARLIYEAIQGHQGGRKRVSGVKKSAPLVFSLLSEFTSAYRRGEFPSLRPGIETLLFTTLHSYLAWELLPHKLVLRTDERGSLFEMVRGQTAHQVFFSNTKPGIVRGNHYHTRKIERFCVVQGEAEIRLRHMLSGEIKTFLVNGTEPVALDMPTYWTHSIRNFGLGDLLTAFWTSEQYNPEDTDTFFAET